MSKRRAATPTLNASRSLFPEWLSSSGRSSYAETRSSPGVGLCSNILFQSKTNGPQKAREVITGSSSSNGRTNPPSSSSPRANPSLRIRTPPLKPKGRNPVKATSTIETTTQISNFIIRKESDRFRRSFKTYK